MALILVNLYLCDGDLTGITVGKMFWVTDSEGSSPSSTVAHKEIENMAETTVLL